MLPVRADSASIPACPLRLVSEFCGRVYRLGRAGGCFLSGLGPLCRCLGLGRLFSERFVAALPMFDQRYVCTDLSSPFLLVSSQVTLPTGSSALDLTMLPVRAGSASKLALRQQCSVSSAASVRLLYFLSGLWPLCRCLGLGAAVF